MLQKGIQNIHPGVAAHSLIALTSKRWLINVKAKIENEAIIKVSPVFFLFILISSYLRIS
jgi:hypothetical protein